MVIVDGRGVIVSNSIVGIMMFTALWWVMVNVPEYFNHATIYLFALIVYVMFSSISVIPSYGFNTEHIAKQIMIGAGASMIILLPFVFSRTLSATITIATLSPVSIFFIVIVAPIVEEMFFRGLVLPLLSYRFGNVYIGIIATAIIFALFHYGVYGISLNNMMWLIVLACILGFLAVYTGSLIPSIMLHMANNIVGAMSLMGLSSVVALGLLTTAITAFIAFIAYIRYDVLFIFNIMLATAVIALSAYSLINPIYDLGLYGEISALVLISVAIPLALQIVYWIARMYEVEITDMIAYATTVITSISVLVVSLYLGFNPILAVLGVMIGVSIGILLEEI